MTDRLPGCCFVEIARTGIVATVAGAVLITNAPCAQGMKLPRGDHLSLKIHGTGQYKLNGFASKLGRFPVDIPDLKFLLSRICCRVTACEVFRIEIFCLCVVNGDLSL